MKDGTLSVYHVWTCLSSFFATDYQSAKRSFWNKQMKRFWDKCFLQDEYNKQFNKIWRKVHYQYITFKNALFCFVFCNWLPICHLKDPFEASKWKSLETRFVQYDEYYTIDMIWWYMKNLSHLVERSIISVSL